MRQLLKNLIDECKQCYDCFMDNMPFLVEEGKMLSDEQIEWVIIKLNEKHQHHEEVPDHVR